MHQDSRIRVRLTQRMGHAALFVALAVVPVLALNSLATADTSTDPRPAPTDAQRECLAEQGATLPAHGSSGEKPALSKAQHRQLRHAGQACSLQGNRGRPLRALTDDQRQCLADQGVTLPARSADGTRPHLSAEQRDALRQAAEACGLPLRGHHGGAVDGKV